MYCSHIHTCIYVPRYFNLSHAKTEPLVLSERMSYTALHFNILSV